jgi:hypothetical protein
MKDLVAILRANSECHAPHLMLQAADEIELLRIGAKQFTDEFNRQTEIIVTLRQDLKEAKARNTMYLSKIQEYEAREQ